MILNAEKDLITRRSKVMVRKCFAVIILTIVLSLLFVVTSQGEVHLTYVDGTKGVDAHQGAQCLIDGRINTKWCLKMNGSCYIIFKTDTPVYITGYEMITAEDDTSQRGRSPQTWTLYGSNAANTPKASDQSWEIIDKRVNDMNMQNCDNWQGYAFIWDEEIRPYNFYMLKIDKNHGNAHLQLSEFKLISDRKIDAVITVTENRGDAVISLNHLDFNHTMFEVVPGEFSGSEYLYWDGGLQPIKKGDTKTITLKALPGFNGGVIKSGEEQACSIDESPASVRFSDFVCIKIQPVRY